MVKLKSPKKKKEIKVPWRATNISFPIIVGCFVILST